MDTVNYLKNSELQECYEVHSLFYRDWCIGDFKIFNTLEGAKEEGRNRLENNKSIRSTIIRKFFKKDGHIYYDGTYKCEYVRSGDR